MADNAFDRTPIYPLEKPLCEDVNQGFSQSDRSLRDTLFALLNGANGFVRGALQVVPQSPAALGVTIKAGVGFYDAPTDVPTSIGGVVGVNDLARYKPIILAEDLNAAVPAPPGANSRIDLIEVRYNRQTDNQQSRNFLNTSTGAFVPTLVAKTLDFTVDGTLAYYAATDVPTTALAYKSGVASGSPSAPATDTGYMPLAYVTVATGVVSIVAANIADKRAIITQSAYLGRQIFTVSGTYTPTPGTTLARATICGGGGGGGGCAGPSTGFSCVTGGGASGAMVVLTASNSGRPVTGGTVTIGAGGAGGAAGANAGQAGGDSSVEINGTLWTAKGGAGSLGCAASTPPFMAAGASITYGSGIADYYAAAPGGYGSGLSADHGLGGNGGASPLGVPGLGAINAGGGSGSNNAVNYGAGGGGVFVGQGISAQAGGSGAYGIVIIDEWG